MSGNQSRFVWACIGLSMLFTAGCGGSVSESTPEPIALSDLAGTLAAAVCDAEAPCCTAAQIAYDGESCRQTATAWFQARLQRFEDGYTRYDAAAVGPCMDAWVAAAQSCMSTPASNEVARTCALMFKGMQPDGAACNSEIDCASSGSGCGSSKTGLAVCTHDLYPFVHGALGAECVTTCIGEPCILGSPSSVPPSAPFDTACYREDGLACGASGTCTAPAQLGDACSPYSCVDGAFCEAGQCVPERDSGPCDDTEVACSSASECIDGECQLKQPDGSSCMNVGVCQGQCDLPVGVQIEADGSVPIAGVCIKAGFASRQRCAGKP